MIFHGLYLVCVDDLGEGWGKKEARGPSTILVEERMVINSPVECSKTSQA